MSSCNVYKNGILLGAGTITNGSTTISSFTGVATVGVNRNIQVQITSSTDSGKWFGGVYTTADGGTSLTISQPNPWAT